MNKNKSILILSFTIVFLMFSSCKEGDRQLKMIEKKEKEVVKTTISPHCEFGIPKDDDSTDDYIIIRPQYILSYNKNMNVCNWVSWNLDKEWYGDVPRFSGNFKRDTLIPEGWFRIKHSDYTNSGYDRGHMVRSKERTKTEDDNISTFYLTNVLPQRPDLNRGVWLKLEYYCEDLCKNENKELYVIAGGIFHSDSTLKSEGLVSVPDSCFKIIVILDIKQGYEDISTITEVIAVVIPNTDGIRSEDWELYKTSVDRIEESTGYDFLNAVPVEIQEIIESK